MRTTVYLDDQLNARLREFVPDRGLNRFISEAVAEKVAALEEERLLREMKEGYIATAAESDEIAKDWEAVDLEGWPE